VIRSEVAAVLGVSDAGAIPSDCPLKELGLDSLMSLRVRDRLTRLTGERLPPTLLFDHPTTSALTIFIAETLGWTDQTSSQPERPRINANVNEPIALLAMSCRYPGGVDSPEALWQLINDECDAIGPFPERPGWDTESLYDPDQTAVGKIVSREGGYLEDVSLFDAGFFRISPREAERLDPQQRLLLEASWEVIERARILPASLSETATGVYVGMIYDDYAARFTNHPALLDGHIGPGSFGSTASGRISYTLGLQGPALTINTACSSSLVAIHTAMQALRLGDCDLSLAGGITVQATPASTIEASRSGGLAPDGRCKPFSDIANGIGMAEGCGMVLLARLSDARRLDYPIAAVIRGNACNQDGRSQGLTAPSGPAQEKMIRRALQSADLKAADVDVIEAHGTGTPLGDPIELNAISSTYGAEHSDDSPIYIGSVKSNIGHTQAAAGVAGVIKMALALQHERLPKTLHTDPLTRHIDWSDGSMRVLDEAVTWPRQIDRPRRAAISAFGMSGTNVHLILEDAPTADPPILDQSSIELPEVPLVLSARSEAALRASAGNLAEHLNKQPKAALVDVACSLATTRTAFSERVTIAAKDVTTAIESLQAFSESGVDSNYEATTIRATARDSELVFVFPGHGSHHPGMCRSLLKEPIFRTTLIECDELLEPLTNFSVLALLEATEDEQIAAFEKFEVLQPVLFAVAIALTRQWEYMGVQPAAVIGHSQGEVAAAVVSGALSLADGAYIVALRSRLIAGLPEDGAMASVSLSHDNVRDRLADQEVSVSVALVNGPLSTVVAGNRHEIQEFVKSLESEKIKCRFIAVDRAGHSPQVDSILGDIRTGLRDLSPRQTMISFYSTVRGIRMNGAELNADYWVDNLRQPVRLDLALKALPPKDARVFLEVSAHPVLGAPLTASGCESVVATLQKDQNASKSLRLAAGALHTYGIDVDWKSVFHGTGATTVDLPTYSFQRRHYWLSAPMQEGVDLEPAVAELDDEPELEHSLSETLQTQTANERIDTLIELLTDQSCAVLGIDDLNELEPGQSLLDLGLDSLMMVDLLRHISRRTGVKVPGTFCVEYPTVLGQAQAINALLLESGTLEEAAEAEDSLPVRTSSSNHTVLPQPWIEHRIVNSDARLRLFCYPHSGGSAGAFRTWQEALPDSVEVCPLQPPGRWSRFHEPPFESVEAAAESLVTSLEPLFDRPFAFFGHSVGASVVFEAARLLDNDPFSKPAGIFVAARNAPHVPTFLNSEREFILKSTDDQLLGLIARVYGWDRLQGAANPEFRQMFMTSLRADIVAASSYEYTEGDPLNVPLWAFGGKADELVPPEDISAWSSYTNGAFEWSMLSGDHFFVHSLESKFLSKLSDSLTMLVGQEPIIDSRSFVASSITEVNL